MYARSEYVPLELCHSSVGYETFIARSHSKNVFKCCFTNTEDKLPMNRDECQSLCFFLNRLNYYETYDLNSLIWNNINRYKQIVTEYYFLTVTPTKTIFTYSLELSILFSKARLSIHRSMDYLVSSYQNSLVHVHDFHEICNVATCIFWLLLCTRDDQKVLGPGNLGMTKSRNGAIIS